VDTSLVIRALGLLAACGLMGLLAGWLSVSQHFARKHRDYDPNISLGQQPDVVFEANEEAQKFFPLYWYYGNMLAGWIPGAVIALNDWHSQGLLVTALAPVAFILANACLYFTCGQKHWEKTESN
jgi:hypothetical protein